MSDSKESQIGSWSTGDARVPLGSTKKRPGDTGVGAVRPTDFSSHNIILPGPRLGSAKLDAASRAKSEQQRLPKPKAGGAEIPRPGLRYLPGIRAGDRPSWTEVVSDELATKRRTGEGDSPRGLELSRMVSEEAKRKQHSGRRGDKTVDDLEFDSPLPYRRSTDILRTSVFAFIGAVAHNRRFTQGLVAMVFLLFVSSFNVTVGDWFSKQFATAKEKVVAAAISLTRPIEERAAFFIADDFQSKVEHWLSRGSASLSQGSVARVSADNMFLREDTLRFASYRMDFDAKIQSGAVGWAVRASDFQNFYGFKLVESKRRGRSQFHFERFTLANGVKLNPAQTVRIELPRNLVRSGGYNRISVRARGVNITTMVNGWGVDYWQDSHFDRGGVGLFADAGESALINRWTISGNDDSWGLFLYGTIETVRSVRERVSPSAAFLLLPSPLVTSNNGPYPVRLSTPSR